MLLSNEQTKRSSWEYFLLRAAREISLSEAQYEKINDRYSQLEKILSARLRIWTPLMRTRLSGSLTLKALVRRKF